MSDPKTYGVLAEFAESEELVAAITAARDAGYCQMDAYTPFPVAEVEAALRLRKSRIPLYMLLAGLAAGALGYLMQWWATVISYPLHVGGRPLHSWPSYIPPTFEMIILGAAVTGFVAVLVRNKLPQPYHPLFGVAGFERATQDRFFLCIEATDEKFDANETQTFLRALSPTAVNLVREEKGGSL